MKQKLIKSLAVGLTSIGMLFTYPSTVSATSQYSAKRSRKVKLIWRKSMGRHAFLAPTGARFSKHLGTRYGYNTETADVTWYTDAHEKLYLKNLNMYSIYYHVTNSDQSLQGWIWKGYMKPVNNNNEDETNPNSGSTTRAGNNNGNSSNRTNNGSGNSGSGNNAIYNYYNKPIDNSLVDSSLNQQAIQVFPNTTPNNQIQRIANKYSLGEPANAYSDSLDHAVGDPYSGYASTETIKLNEKNFTHTTIFEIPNSQRTRPLITQLQSGSIDSKEYLNTVIPMMVEDSGGQKK